MIKQGHELQRLMEPAFVFLPLSLFTSFFKIDVRIVAPIKFTGCLNVIYISIVLYWTFMTELSRLHCCPSVDMAHTASVSILSIVPNFY